jgi:hypothetical protein
MASIDGFLADGLGILKNFRGSTFLLASGRAMAGLWS